MATLILQSAGTALGGVFGGPVGAMVGRSLGGLAGNPLDHALFGSTLTRDGPRLADMPGIASLEGAPIPRLYGRARLGGQIIWATRFLETSTTQAAGGKGLGGARNVETRTYAYTANFAVGLCEGPVAYVRNIWADGKLLDWASLTIRLYRGDEAQEPDPLIIAKEGAAHAPAYRGLAYLVFENFPLADYGNRIPQFAFEIVKPVAGVASSIRAVNVIPGAGEFVYDPDLVTAVAADGTTDRLTRHQFFSQNDFDASVDQLIALCPQVETVQLVVTWFGDDLRAGSCRIRPRVETPSRQTRETEWIVAGQTRETTPMVSLVNGDPAYGGTPSDATIIRAIRALKARGLKVVLYPFIMMDIATDNHLPDPWSGAAPQPAFPWRGRITTERAIGRSDTSDGTMRVDQELAAFFGSITLADLQRQGDTVFATREEWSFRRLIFHYARLLQNEGLDGLIIGSELRGLTRLRNAAGQFVAVQHLVRIARELRAVFPSPARLLYAADWTEYGSYVTANGDVFFPLDPLFADDAISAVGIDAYWPLSDWRDGPLHRDRQIAHSIYDRAYLASRFGAGENYDWYYANGQADRDAQIRTPITDGQYQEPWIYRSKDLVSWWSNRHYERIGGVRMPTPTAWSPQSKPVHLVEFGCPAVDRGSNAPNVFPDPKSSENATPPYSRGGRDDLIQLRVLEAFYQRFDPQSDGFDPAHNPVSPLYHGPMLDCAAAALWAWDARPFPAFPERSDIWADAANYEAGHWLNGRLENLSLDQLILEILRDFDLPDAKVDVAAVLQGYVIDRPLSARAALEPLVDLFRLGAAALSDRVAFSALGHGTPVALDEDDLVPFKDKGFADVTRVQDNELPQEVRIAYSDADSSYRSASVASRRMAGGARSSFDISAPVVMQPASAQRLADLALYDQWSRRETVKLQLRPGLASLEPGDLVTLDAIGHRGIFRIEHMQDAVIRSVEARAIDPDLEDLASPRVPVITAVPKVIFAGLPQARLMSLPPLDTSPVTILALAASARPWRGPLTIWRAIDGSAFSIIGSVNQAAHLGRSVSPHNAGPVWRFDLANHLDIDMPDASLASRSEIEALSAKPSLAILGEDSRWEILSYQNVERIGSDQFRLSRLLRGLGGTEILAARSLAAGRPVVLLDAALQSLATGTAHLGETWVIRIVPSGLEVSDPSALELVTSLDGLALQPLAPVRPDARRYADGIHISWIRRARENSDNWGVAEIALDEGDERYEIEILDQGRVVRTLTTTLPTVLYPTALEQSDFGQARAVLSVRIYQLSRAVGRGAACEAQLIIR